MSDLDEKYLAALGKAANKWYAAHSHIPLKYKKVFAEGADWGRNYAKAELDVAEAKAIQIHRLKADLALLTLTAKQLTDQWWISDKCLSRSRVDWNYYIEKLDNVLRKLSDTGDKS